MVSEPYVAIHPDDAQQMGIQPSEQVRVATSAGELVAAARLAPNLEPGTLFVPASFPGTPVSVLFERDLDPRSRSPLAKSCRAKLEKLA